MVLNSDLDGTWYVYINLSPQNKAFQVQSSTCQLGNQLWIQTCHCDEVSSLLLVESLFAGSKWWDEESTKMEQPSDSCWHIGEACHSELGEINLSAKKSLKLPKATSAQHPAASLSVFSRNCMRKIIPSVESTSLKNRPSQNEVFSNHEFPQSGYVNFWRKFLSLALPFWGKFLSANHF